MAASKPLTDDNLARLRELTKSYVSVLVPQSVMMRLLDEITENRRKER